MYEVSQEEIVSSFVKEAAVTRPIATSFVNAVISTIKTYIERHKSVAFADLGIFVPLTKEREPFGKEVVKIEQTPEFKEFKESVEITRRKIGIVADILKNFLTRGRKVILRDIGALEVKVYRPEIEVEPSLKVLKPPVCYLSFSHFLPPWSNYIITFAANTKFEKELREHRVCLLSVIAPERDFFIDTIVYHYHKRGINVSVIIDPYEAYNIFLQEKPLITVVDTAFVNCQELCQQIKYNKHPWQATIIMLHSEETRPLFDSPLGVLVKGDVNIYQPYEFDTVKNAINQELQRLSAGEELERRICLVASNTEESRENIVTTITNFFKDDNLDEKGIVTFSAAFRESVENARIHGNKGSTKKRLEIRYCSNSERIETTVIDQGSGFDYRPYLKTGMGGNIVSIARDSYIRGKIGGLGIAMMLKYSDRLEYNEKGNEVRLTKFLKTK
jgi:anti-sigma regulatory factor (Ser/Thr protein kinase)/nucleoid DNA-binding protein